MAGIGKTTLARATYLQISNEFECRSFLERVRELSKRDGLPSLQEKILSDILFDKTLKVKSLAEGKGLMCSRMNNRKVLIVLDDVDDIEQLEALAADVEWFGKGSRIIITTRDKIWLERPIIKFEIYNATLLNPTESIQLFSLYAFGETNPPEDYKDYSSHVVHYARGLPVVLKVLGSTLCGSTKEEWNSALSKLEAAGENKVFESLKVSFDGLTEIDQKIFLDTACFFKGMKMDYVTRVLDSVDLRSRFGIKRLIQKSLIWVSSDQNLQMHDRIQEMGLHIVWKVSVDEPGRHSRLWLREHIYDVFRNNTATNAIEGLSLGSGEVGHFEVGIESFKKMNGLRLLLVHTEVNAAVPVPSKLDWFSKATKLLSKKLRFTVGSTIKCQNDLYLPNSLRWLTWKYYRSPSLPESFGAANLVGLEMPTSDIVCLWNGRKNLDKLRYINLECSRYLKVSPDIGWMPNLQTLNLDGCSDLEMLHSSFAYHEQLVFQSCMGCINLWAVPSSIEMKSLETLIFTSCQWLGYFPHVKNMKRLSTLHLNYTDIEKLPASIEELSSLVYLNINMCEKLRSLPSTICGLKHLRTLDVSGCREINTLPEGLGQMECLEELITTFPEDQMGQMQCLDELFLNNNWAWNITKILASFCATSSKFCSIKRLFLSDCNLSEGTIPDDLRRFSYLEELDLSNNRFNCLPASICQLPKLKYLDVSKCSKLDAMQALPSSISMLKADETRTFTSFPDLSIKYESLWKISLWTNCEDHDEPSNLVLKSLLQGHLVANHLLSILLSGSNIPKWFSSYSLGNCTHLHQPSNWYKGDLLGFALSFCACLRTGYWRDYIEIQFDLLEKGTTSYHLATPDPPRKSSGTKVWLGFMSFDFFQLLFPEYQPCDWTTYEGSIGLQFCSIPGRDCITRHSSRVQGGCQKVDARSRKFFTRTK